MNTARITANVGIELNGVDLAAPLDSDDLSLLRATIAQYHVVMVRDQFLSVSQHAQLGASLGPIVSSPVQVAAGAPNAEVSTIVDTARRPPAGFSWHSDLSWTRQPPTLGLLSAVTIPAFGGDTMWASTAAIYDSLTPDERDQCELSSVRHVPDSTLLESVRRHHGAEFAARLQREHPGVDHPLVRRNPITRRRSLFLSPLYTQRITGPAGLDGTLLQRLNGMLDDPHMHMRWRWRQGDVAIWDETATCHRALTDHQPQHRVMRRCVIGLS